MDRSLLSDRQVIAASRNFVCIRLATYEDEAETKYLEEIYGRTLANTVVAFIKPDGKSTLTRPNRHTGFRSGSQMATWMTELIDQSYTDAPKRLWENTKLPQLKSVSLGLNVASCDYVPLVLLIGDDEEELRELESQMLPIAWKENLAGQVAYAKALSSQNLKSIHGLPESKRGIYIVEPDPYGLFGKVVATLSPQQIDSGLLIRTVANYSPAPKNHSSHTRFGAQMGFRWDTETPVTDQQFVRATERIWGEKYEHRPPKKDE